MDGMPATQAQPSMSQDVIKIGTQFGGGKIAIATPILSDIVAGRSVKSRSYHVHKCLSFKNITHGYEVFDICGHCKGHKIE